MIDPSSSSRFPTPQLYYWHNILILLLAHSPSILAPPLIPKRIAAPHEVPTFSSTSLFFLFSPSSVSIRYTVEVEKLRESRQQGNNQTVEGGFVKVRLNLILLFSPWVPSFPRSFCLTMSSSSPYCLRNLFSPPPPPSPLVCFATLAAEVIRLAGFPVRVSVSKFLLCFSFFFFKTTRCSAADPSGLRYLPTLP